MVDAKCKRVKIVFDGRNMATFRSVILQTKFPSTDCHVAQPHLPSTHHDLPSSHITPPSHRTATAHQLPFQPYPDIRFANREMTKTLRTRPEANWKILKATGTVQYKPTFARPTNEKLVETKMKWNL